MQAQYRIAVESQGEDVARRQRDFALVRLNRTEVDDGFAHQYYAAAALRLDFAGIGKAASFGTDEAHRPSLEKIIMGQLGGRHYQAAHTYPRRRAKRNAVGIDQKHTSVGVNVS
ncbi:hypothetical protein D3C78_1205410 [compost metagenome]